MTIPLNEDVAKSLDVGVNVGVNKLEQTVLEEIIKNPQLNAENLSHLINKSKRTAERYIKSLQTKGYLERIGSDKNGHWKILK